MHRGPSTLHIHPSVRALLNAYPMFDSPEGAIVHLAREKLSFAKQFNWEGPPFCPVSFCSFHGIRCEEVEEDIRCDGRIVRDPKSGDAVIQYAKDRSLERIRFTIFHEFAHTLFPDYCQYVAQHHNKRGITSEADRNFENLCDRAAAELLFPEEDFNDSLSNINVKSLSEVVSLSQEYLASLEATCRRIAFLEKNLAVTFLFITDKWKSNFPKDGTCWVRNYATTSSTSKVILPGTVPPVGSMVYRCLESAKPMEITHEAQEQWVTKTGNENFTVQVIRLPKVNCEASPKAIVHLTEVAI